MRLEGVQAGDVVEVDRLGRRFHALVTSASGGALQIRPLDRRTTYTSCKAREVVGHWARRGRPKASDDPLRPGPSQLELPMG